MDHLQHIFCSSSGRSCAHRWPLFQSREYHTKQRLYARLLCQILNNKRPVLALSSAQLQLLRQSNQSLLTLMQFQSFEPGKPVRTCALP